MSTPAPVPDNRVARNAETPLQLPSVAQALRTFGRAFRLRCPDCGKGRVLTTRGRVRERCSACGLRYARTDGNYFSGAMFFGLLMGELLFAVTLLFVVVGTWPNVPWNALTYGAPAGMLLIVPFLIPFSKVVWLTVDVLVRPVMPEEKT
jgi:uncharacterized protein (DUF983 family)